MKLVRSLAIWVLLLAALAPAGAAAAETRSFLKTGTHFPSGDGNGTFGPSLQYPSTIAVAGVPGTVTKVTATVFGLNSGSPDDIDMVLVGPNEERVMLMSDACGTAPNSLGEDTWTFDDAALSFISDNGPCPPGQLASFRPSNYENPELDDLSEEGGGPPPPYSNSLSVLAGSSAEGAWQLFVLDDNKVGYVGFGFNAWVLTLEVEPPPPPPPTIVTVTAPGPSTSAGATGSVTPPATAGPTKKSGKRAAALAKCKAKKSKSARQKCRQNARKLPV